MKSLPRWTLVVCVLGGSPTLAGCPDASTGTDAAGVDASLALDARGSACTDLVAGGAFVPETPGVVFFGATGGTIADGTYHLTEFDIFPPGSVDAFLRKHTLRFDGDRIEVVTQRDDQAPIAMSGTWTASGSTLTADIDCPASMSFTMAYTASDTTFTQVIDEPGTRETHTYTRQ